MPLFPDAGDDAFDHRPCFTYWESPIGWLRLDADNRAVWRIRFMDEAPSPQDVSIRNVLERDALIANERTLQEGVAQLIAYFAGTRRTFDFPMENPGTPFRQQVWQTLCTIPYGETASYKDIAIAIHNPKAVRAIGSANHHNNLWLVVPCHRIIGSNGDLVGYGGGLWRKAWLLAHEKKHAMTQPL